jgi:hypothetical protein
MDAVAEDLIRITDNLKEAFAELAVGHLHHDGLVSLAHRLDAIERSLQEGKAQLGAEQTQLETLKMLLRPLQGFFGTEENLKSALNTRGSQNGVPKKSGIRFASQTTTLSPDSAPRTADSGTISALTSDEFETIPKYLRGRITAERLNRFVVDLNSILAEKAVILRANPARLPLDQRQRLADWRASEVEETRGRVFFSEADLKARSASGSGAFKYDQMARTMLTLLRQAGRIKEHRSAGVIRYIVQ